MGDSPSTRPSLLLRLRDAADGAAWQQFVAVYEPLIYRFARKRGLQDSDAADLTQNVLQAVTGGIGRLSYDPERGSFRGWLFGVVRNQLHKFRAGQRHTPQGSGDTGVQELLEQQPDRADEAAAVWDEEYDQQVFRWAVQKVRDDFADSSWQAFWQTAVEGKSAKEAAQALGMSIGAVYTAKSRILDRVRKAIRQLHGDKEP